MIFDRPKINLENIAFQQSSSNTQVTSLAQQILLSHVNINQILSSHSSPDQSSVNSGNSKKLEKVKTSQTDDKIQEKLRVELATLKQSCTIVYNMLIKPKIQLKPDSKQLLTLLAKSYPAVINLKLLLSKKETQSSYDSIQEDVKSLEKTIAKSRNLNVTESSKMASKLTKLCINELFNLNSLKEYELYNINANEEFKYDSQTQISFLYILAMIKLSNHLKLFSFHKKNPEQLRIIHKIYNQGRETLLKLSETIQSDKQIPKGPSEANSTSGVKIQAIIKQCQQVSTYIEWIETNWMPFLKQQIEGNSKASSGFQQLPIEYMSTYELFFLIYKLSQLENKYVQSDLITPDDSKRNSLILVEGKNITILLNKYIHSAKKSSIISHRPSTSIPILPSTKDKLLCVVQATSRKLELLMQNAQNSHQKCTFDALEEFLSHASLSFILTHVQKAFTAESLQKGSQLEINVMNNQHKNSQKNPTQSVISSKNKSINAMQILQLQIPLQSTRSKHLIKQETKIQAVLKEQISLERQPIKNKDKVETNQDEFKPQKLSSQQKLKAQSINNKIQTSSTKQLIKKAQTIQIKTISKEVYQSKDFVTPVKKIYEHPLGQSELIQAEQKNYKMVFFDGNQMVVACAKGQMLTKFNFNNNSYGLKFVKLSTKSQSLVWADSKQDIKDDPSEQQFSKVQGLVYGDVTLKVQYQCTKSRSSKPFQPWRCFSLVCSTRTLDFYCSSNQYDIYFWLLGLASYMKTDLKMNVNYSKGKIMWKKCLMKIRYLYSPVEPKPTKKSQNTKFILGKNNAKAIINFGKHLANKA